MGPLQVAQNRAIKTHNRAIMINGSIMAPLRFVYGSITAVCIIYPVANVTASYFIHVIHGKAVCDCCMSLSCMTPTFSLQVFIADDFIEILKHAPHSRLTAHSRLFAHDCCWCKSTCVCLVGFALRAYVWFASFSCVLWWRQKSVLFCSFP